MSRYFMDAGSFALPDFNFEDRTVHVLELGGGARLLVDRERLRRPFELEQLVRIRSDREASRFAKFTVLGERRRGLSGVSSIEVAAHFRDDERLAYQRRCHLITDGGALTLTTSGPFGLRADLDRRMEEILESLRFREGEASRPADPALYLTNEIAFDRPAPFVDLTVHVLEAALSGGHVLGLLIGRGPPPGASGLVEAVRADLAAQARRLTFYEILEMRERSVCGWEAVEAVASWAYRGVALAARELHVATAASRVIFTTTAPAEHEASVADLASVLTSTLELDPRAEHGESLVHEEEARWRAR